MPDRDCLRRFLFERLAARGEIAHLDVAWRTVLEPRAYPPAVRQALGAATAAAALLSAKGPYRASYATIGYCSSSFLG